MVDSRVHGGHRQWGGKPPHKLYETTDPPDQCLSLFPGSRRLTPRDLSRGPFVGEVDEALSVMYHSVFRVDTPFYKFSLNTGLTPFVRQLSLHVVGKDSIRKSHLSLNPVPDLMSPRVSYCQSLTYHYEKKLLTFHVYIRNIVRTFTS